jgi:hypothetical protein
MSATIRLTRQARGIELRQGPIEIAIDGIMAASIRRGETAEIPVEPGGHTLRLAAGRYSSRDHPFEASDGETLNFRCHPATVWPRYVASIVVPNLAISLRREK